MLKRLALFAMGVLVCAGASAQAYPSRPVKVVIPWPPGQATDLVARMVAERLTTSMGYPVLVENQPGQGGSIVLSRLAKSTPDGASIRQSAARGPGYGEGLLDMFDVTGI